jgi:hypothetical protein
MDALTDLRAPGSEGGRVPFNELFRRWSSFACQWFGESIHVREICHREQRNTKRYRRFSVCFLDSRMLHFVSWLRTLLFVVSFSGLMLIGACASHAAPANRPAPAERIDSATAVSRALAVIRRTTPASLRVSVFKRDSLGYFIEFVPTEKDVMGGWWQIRVFDNGATKVLGIGQ